MYELFAECTPSLLKVFKYDITNQKAYEYFDAEYYLCDFTYAKYNNL